jgi:hypothetical protein
VRYGTGSNLTEDFISQKISKIWVNERKIKVNREHKSEKACPEETSGARALFSSGGTPGPEAPADGPCSDRSKQGKIV